MQFEVKLTAEAEENVRAIRDWLASQSSSGALRWLDALEAAKNRLHESPDSNSLAPEADEFDDEVRQILFSTSRGNTYRAIFVVRATSVHIVAVRGAGQDLITREDVPELP